MAYLNPLQARGPSQLALPLLPPLLLRDKVQAPEVIKVTSVHRQVSHRLISILGLLDLRRARLAVYESSRALLSPHQ